MRVTKYNVELGKEQEVRLVKERAVNYQSAYDAVDRPEAIAAVLNDCFHLSDMAEEHVYMVACNTKCRPVGFFEVSHGTENLSFMNAREIYIRALLSGASAIFLAHNHPSGDATPSPEDLNATKGIWEAGRVLKVRLLDHIILGNGGTMYSMREHNDFSGFY